MGLFANALSVAAGQLRTDRERDGKTRHPLAGWLLERVRHRAKSQPRLMLVERISLAPRQTVSLVEVDGQRILVATAQEGSPSFCHLNSGVSRRPVDEIPFEGTIE